MAVTSDPSDLSRLDFSKGAGLLPAIIQHADTGAVLMLGYMNAEALAATRARGRVVFYSRSRQRLWEKGETSGHTLNVEAIRIDCDADTLLITRASPRARPAMRARPPVSGTAALTGATRLGFLAQLTAIIEQRSHEPADRSYTAKLFAGGLARMAQKVGEEGVEVALAAVAQADDKLVSRISRSAVSPDGVAESQKSAARRCGQGACGATCGARRSWMMGPYCAISSSCGRSPPRFAQGLLIPAAQARKLEHSGHVGLRSRIKLQAVGLNAEHDRREERVHGGKRRAGQERARRSGSDHRSTARDPRQIGASARPSRCVSAPVPRSSSNSDCAVRRSRHAFPRQALRAQARASAASGHTPAWRSARYSTIASDSHTVMSPSTRHGTLPFGAMRR